jgi:GMP synthase-like glutamine amidotransferase
MRVVVVRHHEEDSPGFVADAFEARGAHLTGLLFPKDGPLPEPVGIDHVILLGADFSVYDQGAARTWIAEELAWLRQVDAAGVPVLGICFGAQALAAAFGGRVEPAAHREVGWTLVESLDPDLIPPGRWLEFHGDSFLPPAGARVLARNDLGVQAFALGRHLAVQFHPEVDGAQLGRWLQGSGRDQAERAGQDPDRLLAKTVMAEPVAKRRADRLVEAALRLAKEG